MNYITVARYLRDDRYYAGVITPDASEITISVNKEKGPFESYNVHHDLKGNYLWISINGDKVTINFQYSRIKPVTIRTTETARTNYSNVAFLAVDTDADLAWYYLPEDRIAIETELINGEYIIYDNEEIFYSDIEDPARLNPDVIGDKISLGFEGDDYPPLDIKIANRQKEIEALLWELNNNGLLEKFLKENNLFGQYEVLDQEVADSLSGISDDIDSVDFSPTEEYSNAKLPFDESKYERLSEKEKEVAIKTLDNLMSNFLS